MTRKWNIEYLAAFLGLFCVQLVHAQGLEDVLYQDAVEYRNGEISVAFDQTPIMVALNVIQAQTGFQIIVPAAAENRLVNLRLNKLPLEPAVRSLISSIGFNNFALMYDANGLPSRAVVIGAGSRGGASADGKSDAAAQTGETASPTLSAAEKEKLERELERWSELKQEERGRIEDRLKSLPPSAEREELLKVYGRQLLGIKQ